MKKDREEKTKFSKILPNNHCMLHWSSSTRNDCEQKINYDWPDNIHTFKCYSCRKTFSPVSMLLVRVSHRCWEHGGVVLQNLMWGLKLIHGGSMGVLKMLSKNTCEVVHLIVELPAISLQACKFTKNELLHTYFWRILARF